MNYRLVHLLAGSALLFVAGAACATAPAPAGQDQTSATLNADAADTAIPHFDIERFDVKGNTLLAPQLLTMLLAPFTGKRRNFGDIQHAVEALENAYRERGYTVVQVTLPEQELERGVVQLNVVETAIGRIAVSGNQHADDANVLRALPSLREGASPNLPALAKSLKLANENPARKIEVKLAGSEVEGQLDASVSVADENPWKTMLNLDNTGNQQTGKTHAGVVLQNANLWGRDHIASLQYTTSLEKPDKVSIYGLGYHVPLYALGDSLDLFASYSNVDSGTVTAGIFDLAVSGRGTMAGLRYNQNFAKTESYEPKLVYGIDYKAYQNSVQLFGFELGGDVTVHPLSVAYIGAWTRDNGEASLALTLSRNIPGGRHGTQADFDLARVGAKAGYSTARVSANWGQVWAGDWQARGIFNAQYTPDALVPGEQFGAGGAASVRGFDERAVSADSGASLNLELYTPNWCGKTAAYQCRALAFYDSAWLSRNHTLPGESQGNAIGSFGIGSRVLLSRYANLQVDYAHVLNPGDTGRNNANRLHVRLALSY
ncbi:ShlB/FhaC/HecB family hemolysin secretion/activation protein [Janthinobacterium agaricidamnosum]|uniref:Surface antigen variable number repeat family protein n=1 Tax=Janthinobacterium agaricidamnosum NBRC 102515 = DSM 9628 TaxID=1349767 RepID=W0VAA5_9BURK|nr:ShlB/FhaC/HecB family hemolysin secretion/activation protein [Janthinobacterium agaricidamnosum]CDG84202.1 surface antigen variable number repeat family protein [Janthinobacterium agaricidamnosum NBRC 102515 = DSM 9628]